MEDISSLSASSRRQSGHGHRKPDFIIQHSLTANKAYTRIAPRCQLCSRTTRPTFGLFQDCADVARQLCGQVSPYALSASYAANIMLRGMRLIRTRYTITLKLFNLPPHSGSALDVLCNHVMIIVTNAFALAVTWKRTWSIHRESRELGIRTPLSSLLLVDGEHPISRFDV